MVTRVKAKIDGMVDSPNFKWGMAGMAVLGAILMVAGQFTANKTALRGAGSALLGLTAVSGAYKLKRVWDARHAKVIEIADSGKSGGLLNGPAGLRFTKANFEGLTDPSMTVVRRGKKVLGIPGMRAHPTAGGYCGDNL
jgi:hypothetical protein